jgi:ankyrin repeat protein
VRKLAIYDEPNLILILRAPENLAEIREILDLPVGSKVEDPDSAFKAYLIVESVVDPKTCKLRLSLVTTVTSVLVDVNEEDPRRRSCFELINPVESIVLSSVKLRTGAERALTSFTDSGAYLETSSAEHALRKSICDANNPSLGSGTRSDLSWQHQIILGTLHSFVVGNQTHLDMAIAAALRSSKGEQANSDYLNPRIVDMVDESGLTPVHYACSSRLSSAVVSLVQAGANVDLRIEPGNMTLCHVCSKNLDDKSLSAILSVNRRPNVVDAFGRTPMYLAIAEGRTVGGQRSPEALDRCLSVLESHGGEIEGSRGYRHPVSYLSSLWRHVELAVVLKHVNFRYPLVLTNAEDKKRIGMSVSAFFQYPVHSTLITLRKKIKDAIEGKNVQHLLSDCGEVDSKAVR